MQSRFPWGAPSDTVPYCQGWAKSKKFHGAPAIERAEGSGDPCQAQGGKGNGRMGRGEPQRAGEEK